MGVSGLWDIISPAERKYSLEELALDSTAFHNKSLRIAIDISIWNIQSRSALGGPNAHLRTIFYRCCRLYTLGIRPVFVFDGEQRPAYKRSQHINTSVSNRVEHHLLLALIKLFGFAVWDAAGEAEAECAVLQRLGYVDIVFTTDVDVFLFGGQRVARNWPGTDYEPISCVDSEWIDQITSFDRSDMVLIALLSGSDYDSGVNKIGIQVALALAKLKYHRPVFDILQNLIDTNTYSNANESPNHPDENDILYTTQLHEMIDKLQHELNTNRSGILRRRHSKIDLKSLIENEQFTKLAKDWIHPNTAILDPSNTEAAKTMYTLLTDENVTPQFVSLASFCQTQFDWSKAKTLEKFAKKLYPGYMLHRTATWHGTSSTISSGTSTAKLHQQTSRRQRIHPYFSKHYRTIDLYYPNENQEQRQPTDLHRIHLIEDLRKTKHGIRSQKLSRCRVEWRLQSLAEFLSMVKTELSDGVGTDADSSQTNINFDSQVDGSIIDSQNSIGNILDRSDHGDDDDDLCIDLTTQQLPPAPAFGPPSLMIPEHHPVQQTRTSPGKSTLSQPITTATTGNDESWVYQYCDPKKCCRQWIGSKLIQKVYPKMMDEFTKAKTKRMPTSIDSSQKRLGSFFTPIHDNSSPSPDAIKLARTGTDTTNNQLTSTAPKGNISASNNPKPQKQHRHSGQSLILPIRKDRTKN